MENSVFKFWHDTYSSLNWVIIGSAPGLLTEPMLTCYELDSYEQISVKISDFLSRKAIGKHHLQDSVQGQYVEKDCSTHLCPDEDGSDLMVDLNHLLVKTSEFGENDLRYHLLRCSHRYIALQIYGLMQQRRNSIANALEFWGPSQKERRSYQVWQFPC